MPSGTKSFQQCSISATKRFISKGIKLSPQVTVLCPCHTATKFSTSIGSAWIRSNCQLTGCEHTNTHTHKMVSAHFPNSLISAPSVLVPGVHRGVCPGCYKGHSSIMAKKIPGALQAIISSVSGSLALWCCVLLWLASAHHQAAAGPGIMVRRCEKICRGAKRHCGGSDGCRGAYR